MSFEGTKKRLVEEFDQVQAEVRAQFGMKTKDEKLAAESANAAAKRATRPAGPPSTSR